MQAADFRARNIRDGQSHYYHQRRLSLMGYDDTVLIDSRSSSAAGWAFIEARRRASPAFDAGPRRECVGRIHTHRRRGQGLSRAITMSLMHVLRAF